MTIRRKPLLIVASAVLVMAAIVALYYAGTEFLAYRADSHPPAAPAAISQPVGGAFNFSFFDQPRPLPDIRFSDDQGRSLSLADFRGQPVLLNVWATWCVPCRAEMPSLERLQTTIGRDQLLVLPLSIDRQGVPVVKAFYGELGLRALGIYVDSSAKVARDLATPGVPTTLLIDADGREVGRKIGAAAWDSPETVALIRQRLASRPSEETRR